MTPFVRSILCVLGTRPEAIKLAPVILKLRENPRLSVSLCVTAQHREMLDDVLVWFGLVPDHDLNLMTANQSLPEFASRALTAVSEVVIRTAPDLVLVQGDTTTVAMASLAAFYQKVPVGHVEAGLRTHRRYDPFPEEMNRRLATALATLHFAPTKGAAEALRSEGVQPDRIHETGNPVVDALLWTLAQSPATDANEPAPGRRVVLVTAHRRENFGARLESICGAILDVVRDHDVDVVFPVHPNPAVRETVERTLSGHPRIRLLPPLRYEQFARLLHRAYIVVTDSGGVQEEAPILGKPTLVLRETSERMEAVDAGSARLIGTNRAKVASEIGRLLTSETAHREMARRSLPFGDGHAAERIAGIIAGWHPVT